jgi:GT2 family glycosyltransferase
VKQTSGMITRDRAEGYDNDTSIEHLMLRIREEVNMRRRRGDQERFFSPSARPPETPLVSVIVLNLNGEAILAKCLGHLLAQSYTPYEIIVVDNGSSDRSLDILREYQEKKNISVVRSRTNLGIPGGRNLWVHHARGDIIAFMDNDGYADEEWLSEAVHTLLAQPDIGAVGSLVFFACRKIILNGAGGTMNLQGFGGDLCFNVPYEFAMIPEDVLYPMGCGMVMKRSALKAVGPLDRLPVKWFDDTELGIRMWKLGYRVAVAKRALVDHDYNTSDHLLDEQAISRRDYMFHRARIRNALKYYPAANVPRWLLEEARYFRWSGRRRTLAKCWGWNVLHVASALYWRLKFTSPHSYSHLLDSSWGAFPPPVPENHSFCPQLHAFDNRLSFESNSERWKLNFGWYRQETYNSIYFRRIGPYASAFFRFRERVHSLMIRYRAGSNGQLVNAIVRRAGDLHPLFEQDLPIHACNWQEARFGLTLEPGVYELLLITKDTSSSMPATRLAVSLIDFS